MNSLLDLFTLFCRTDSDYTAMGKPFEINGRVYATDAYGLIRCDKSNCDFDITNKNTPPDCESIMPVSNIQVLDYIDKSIFEQYKTE